MDKNKLKMIIGTIIIVFMIFLMINFLSVNFIIMIFSVFLIFYAIDNSERFDEEKRKKRVSKLIVVAILLFSCSIFIIFFFPMSSNQTGGIFQYNHSIRTESIEGETFYLINTETLDERGFYEPITESYRLPASDFIWHENNVSDIVLEYRISFETTIYCESFEMNIYGDTNYIVEDESGHEFLKTEEFTSFILKNRIVDNVNVVVYNVTDSIFINLDPFDQFTYIQFEFNAFINKTYYEGIDIYFAQSWIDIQPLNDEASVEFGNTTPMTFSLDFILSSDKGSMVLFAGVFLTIFAIVFLISFMAQKPQIAKWFLTLEMSVAVLLLFYYISRYMADNPEIADIIDGLYNWRLITGWTWIDSFILLLNYVAIIIQVFFWAITIGVSLYLCTYLLQYLEAMTMGFSMSSIVNR